VARFVVAALVAVMIPAAARADEWLFYDPHPVHPAAGGGFCELPGAHAHDYAPVDPGAFVHSEGLWVFVGDPVVYGYRGIVYGFPAGHATPDGALCPIAGAHHHLYGPAVDPGWAAAPSVVVPWWAPPVVVVREPVRPHAFPVAPPVARATRPAVGPPLRRTVVTAPRSPRLLTRPRRPRP